MRVRPKPALSPILTLVFGIGLAGQKAPAPPAALRPGQASGTLTVNGQPVALRYAYADLEEHPFEETKNDIVLILTDRPIPADVLAREEIGGLPGAASIAKVTNYVRIKLREAEAAEKTSERTILGAWVIGHRTISHQALKGTSLQVSPDPISRVDAKVIGKTRVEGVVYTNGPQTFPHDDAHEYSVMFNAAVAPRKAVAQAARTEPGIEPGKGQPLPAGGGEPGKAYLTYNQALRTGDVEGLKRTDASLADASAEDLDQIRKLAPLLAATAPSEVEIVEGMIDGSRAVLTLEGSLMGKKRKGVAEMALAGGVWKLVKDSWD